MLHRGLLLPRPTGYGLHLGLVEPWVVWSQMDGLTFRYVKWHKPSFDQLCSWLMSSWVLLWSAADFTTKACLVSSANLAVIPSVFSSMSLM
jgi:hypothetical protein